MAKKKTTIDYSSLLTGNRQKEEQQAFLNGEARALAELYMGGELAAVVQRAEELLRQYPSWGFGWKVLSGSLAMLGKNDEALAASKKAVQFLPRDPEVLNNQGNILKDLWRLSEARSAYEKAVRLKPDFAVAYNNLANVLKNQGKIAEAIRYYEVALKIDPNFAVAFGNLLLALNYRPQQDPEQYLRMHQGWADRFCSGYPAPQPYCHPATPDRKLAIGYLSADLGRHPVGIFLTPVLQHHQRDNFTVHCYSTRAAEDDYSALLKKDCDIWRNVAGLSNEELAGAIRADGIDILVDLGGHTQSNRLPVFAMKPAPVQVTWLGYPGTTGLAAIDYRLTDAIADPPGESDRYATEQLVRLPHGFLCFPTPKVAVATRDLATTRESVTFGSFNFLPKVTEPAISLWAALLKSVANSRLVLKSPPLADAETAQRILKLFKAAGITRDRIDFLGATATYKDHLLAYHGIDIALDTFPYNGTTTIFEALWMGVPVITLTGKSHVSRVGTSILARLGLNELIAGDEAQYLQLACALATDRVRLSELHRTLRERLSTSSFCDAPGFTTSLEQAYREMWQQYCRLN